jgi:hypothetical protein
MDGRELARIRFVTLRYRELQGLRHLAIMPSCLLTLWLQPYFRLLRYMGPWEALAGFFLSIAPCLLLFPAHHLMTVYYARRFGNVGTSALSGDRVAQVVVVAGGVLIDMWNGTGISATLVAIALVSLQIAVRDRPWRLHHLIGTVVCLAAAATFDIRDSRIGDPVAFLRIPLTIGLFAYGVGAYLDHRLLAVAMPRHPEASESALAADHADSL